MSRRRSSEVAPKRARATRGRESCCSPFDSWSCQGEQAKEKVMLCAATWRPSRYTNLIRHHEAFPGPNVESAAAERRRRRQCA